MAIHKIEPNENTLHGFFSRDLAPILTIDSGDTVHFKAIDAEWGLENFNVTLVDPEMGPPPRKTGETNIEGSIGHALCGPVFIRGAEPGMTLAIHIDSIQTGTWGWTVGFILTRFKLEHGVGQSEGKRRMGRFYIFGNSTLINCADEIILVIKLIYIHSWV